jgi:hypothetical protein
LKPPQTFQMPGVNGAQPGTPAGANPQQTTSFGASGFGPAPTQQGQPGQQGAGANQGGANTGQPGSGTQTASGNATTPDDAANATPSGMVSSDSPLMGGNIIGVGSKINKRSVMIYDKAKNYRLFEFVWNPSKDVANALNQQMGAPKQNPQGQSGFSFGPQNPQQINPQNNNQPNPPTTDMPLPTPPEPPPTPPPDQN